MNGAPVASIDKTDGVNSTTNTKVNGVEGDDDPSPIDHSNATTIVLSNGDDDQRQNHSAKNYIHLESVRSDIVCEPLPSKVIEETVSGKTLSNKTLDQGSIIDETVVKDTSFHQETESTELTFKRESVYFPTDNANASEKDTVSEINEEDRNAMEETFVKEVFADVIIRESSGTTNESDDTDVKAPTHQAATKEQVLREDSVETTNESRQGTVRHNCSRSPSFPVDYTPRHNIRNENTRRQVVAGESQPQQPKSYANFNSKLVTSSNTNELLRCLLSVYLEETKSNGIDAQSLRRRTFGVPILVLKIETKPIINDESDIGGLSTNPAWISNEDIECISAYLNTRGFKFLCRDGNCLCFSVNNRNTAEVNSEINRLQEGLRNVCFGRFFGRVVNGHRINSLEDLILSFHIEGSTDRLLSWRFYYLLSERGIIVDCKQTRHVLLRKSPRDDLMTFSILLMYVWFLSKLDHRK